MTTKIRLTLDLVLQFSLLLVFGIRIFWYPEHFWRELGVFALLISSWQVLHALYLARKYKNWEKRTYLNHVKQIIGYGLLTVGISGLMYVGSFGLLAAFLEFLLKILYIAVCLTATGLALHSFAMSVKNVYQYYASPRSFWDL